jgi:hypothetical protein
MKKRNAVDFTEQNRKTLEEWRKGDRVDKVKIGGMNDNHVCDECRKLANTEYPVDEAPVLPHTKCTSKVGCRCYYQPVVSVEGLGKRLDDIFKS